MLERIIDLIEPAFAEWGLLIVFAATFLESAVIVASVVPGETVLLLGGFFSAPDPLGDRAAILSLPLVALTAFAGAFAGGIVAYVTGRVAGRAFIRRFGRFVFLSERRLPLFERYVAQYGGRAILFGRFAPFLRSVRALLAGIAKMPFHRFLLAEAIGSALWVTAIVLIGFTVGESWRVANRYLGPGGVLVLVVLVVGFWFTWRSLKRRVEVELASVVPPADPARDPSEGREEPLV